MNRDYLIVHASGAESAELGSVGVSRHVVISLPCDSRCFRSYLVISIKNANFIDEDI